MEINDRTKIGLFAVIGAVPIIFGWVFWISMIYFKADAAERINEKQDLKIDAQTVLLLEIRDKLTRLESRVITRER